MEGRLLLGMTEAAPLAASGGSNTLLTLLPFIVLIAVFYFLLIRPQRNRQKKMQEMQNELIPGQQVLTTAAMYATVVVVDDDAVVLEIAPGVEARFNRAAIAQVLSPVEDTPEVPDSPAGLDDDMPSDLDKPEEPPEMGADGLPEDSDKKKK
jgi:preprotein translocase subunit YajC